MGVHSTWRSGVLLGEDGWNLSPFTQAPFARYAYGAFEHFTPSLIVSTTSYPGYTVTQITAGTLVMADAAGGWLNLTGGAADGRGIQMQAAGEAFIPAAEKDIWFEASIKIADADDMDWFVGLASTDTNVFSTDPTDIIAFRGDDDDTNIDFQARKAGAGAQADTGSDTANTTAVRLGFWVKGVTSIVPYINGVAQTAVTANIPVVEMCLTFGALDGATTASNTLGLDWYRIVQLS